MIKSLRTSKDCCPSVHSAEVLARVVLVDQSDRFVFKPVLYELLSGEVDAWEIAPSFTKNTGVQFMKDRVKVFGPSDHLNLIGIKELGKSYLGGLVHLESGIMTEYD
ncbi:alternative NAD(P)H-ubiquinone oxidoreductase C1, chloroplastic/mitochondrial-like [Typha angustifolia]|uniref:alternative NAD(P)H-ubiquinone oxidoreductase C1, chloroplastic/mitochondrial-like n=1 Tax=Typha angustifolia TaxID=59011 RepID=UPI003C2F11C4